MKKFFNNSVKKIITLLLLGFFLFSFLHSELGFLDFDGDNHGDHDYCQIVKNTNAHSKILIEDLPKLELNKDICIHCLEKVDAQTAQIHFEIRNLRQLIKNTTGIYLFNKTILI